jgi:hypothetical protein
MVGDIPLSTLGRITQGKEAGRVVEVLDDRHNTGGFLIFTYADEERSPEVFDCWVETHKDIDVFFQESDWKVNWLRP